MSWLRSSPLRQSLTGSGSGGGGGGGSGSGGGTTSGNSFFAWSDATSTVTSSILRQRPIDTATDCDPRACYDSFCKHWQQAYDIIQRSELPHKPPTHDDVLGVVSHLDFMVTLLLVELHHCNKVALPSNDGAAPPAPCLEYMLSENLLDKLYEWGCTTGRYANAVRLEQLKLYELLVSHSRHQLLCHEPFLRPLLKILASSQGEIFPPDLEKRLVILLNQLCVVLMQNVHLLDLFFFSAAQEQSKQHEHNETHKTPQTNFIIFSLLIPYVHREGSLGHQARDALLLCMALSQKNSNIGTYIAQYSSMCPLLVTGLGGLYSRLPNSIEITSIDWHRITPDDVTEIAELTLFMNALEFCNAVAEVAHEMIRHQLLDFMYQGFIVPVLGPAILQTLKGKHFQTNVESQVSAMSYLDLILRSVTEPGLLRAFVHFLLDSEKFDGVRIIDVLIERISAPDANLCMVTMALFDTLLGLNCEDLMLELLLKFLLPGKHVPISHRHKINKIDPYTNSAEFFLELTPDVMKRVRDLTKHKHLGDTVTSNNNNNNSSSNGGGDGWTMVQPPVPSPTSTMSKTIGANWNYYGLHSGDSLYANLQAYLFEAHFRIAQCQSACAKWANTYKYQRWPPRTLRASALDAVRQFFAEFGTSPLASHGAVGEDGGGGGERKQLDSLQSIGESSGYESFKWRPTEEDGDAMTDATTTTTATNTSADLDNSNSSGGSFSSNGNGKTTTTATRTREWWRISNHRSDLLLTDLDFSEDLFAQGTVSLGPFLNAIWGKLQTFTSNTLYVNLHLTGLITHLAWYPLPLVHSLLLRPDIVITSDTPSFHQVLRILKQQIDAELPVIEDSLEIIDVARSYLIDREFRLINARKASEHSPLHTIKSGSVGTAQRGSLQPTATSTYASISATSPVQVTPSSSYDPFKRNDTKRKSISKSITSMFSRKPNGTSTSSPFGSGNAATANSSAASSTHETSLSTLPHGAAGGGNQSAAAAATAKQQSAAAQSMVGASAVSSSSASSSSAATSYMSSGHSSLSSNASHSLSTGSNVTVSNNNNNNANNSTLSSTLSAASSVVTLLAGQSGASGGGGGGGSEPVSLESLGSMGAIANTSGTERTRDLALCAVLLDEWLKELAAIAQEQSVVLVSECL